MKLDFNKIFVRLYSILLFITPLVMFHKTSEIFEFNKMLFIYLMTGIIVAVWVARMMAVKKIILRKTVLFLPLLAFLAVHIISTIFSVDMWTSIFGYYGRFNGGLISMIAYVLLYFAFVSNVSLKPKHVRNSIRTLLSSSLLSSIIVMMWGFPSRFGYDLTCKLFTGELSTECWTQQFVPTERIFSTLGQPNWLGAYLAAHVFIGLYFFFTSGEFKKRGLYALYFIAAIIMVLFTRSRSALLAVVFAGLIFDIYIVLNRKTYFSKEWKPWLAVLALGLLIPVFVLGTGVASIDSFWKTAPAQEKPALQNNDEQSQEVVEITGSGEIRKIVWQGAFSIGLEHPLFGTGVETFAYTYPQLRPLAHNATSEWDFVYNKAHSEVFHYLATTGFLGAGVYLLLIGLVVIHLGPVVRKELNTDDELLVLSLICAYIAISITNFLGFSTTMINVLLYTLPAMIVLTVYREKLQELTSNVSINDKKVLIIPFLILGCTAYCVTVYFLADVSYAAGERNRQVQDYYAALDNYYTAYNLRQEHVYADKISQILAQLAFVQSISADQPLCNDKDGIQRDCILLSDDYAQIALEGSSHNPLYHRSFARNNFIFFQMTGDEKYYLTASESMWNAFKLAPTDPRYPYMRALFALGKFELIQNPTEDDIQELEVTGKGTIELATSLKPDYLDALYMSGLINKELGLSIEAREDFEKMLIIDPDNVEAQEELDAL